MTGIINKHDLTQVLTFLVFVVFFTCKRGKREQSAHNIANEMMKDGHQEAEHIDLTNVHRF